RDRRRAPRPDRRARPARARGLADGRPGSGVRARLRVHGAQGGAAVIALVAALALGSTFEGELQMKLASPGVTGKVAFTISPRGLRTGLEAELARRPLRTTVLVRVAEPEVGLALDPVRKTVQRVDLAAAADALGPRASRSLRVERLGREKVLA